jgi:hypothetical protein
MEFKLEPFEESYLNEHCFLTSDDVKEKIRLIGRANDVEKIVVPRVPEYLLARLLSSGEGPGPGKGVTLKTGKRGHTE